MKKIKSLLTKKNIFFSFFILLLIFLFFQFFIVFTPDSTEYYTISLILKNKAPFNEWIITRGFSLPLLLSIFTSLFGENINALKIGQCIYYLLLVFFGYKILKKFSSSNDKYTNIIVYGLYLILVVFNPIIFSYEHVILTESVMPFILLLSIIISYKYVSINYKDNKKKFVFYTLYFIVITIFVWFLKQPYTFTILGIIFFSSLLKFLESKDKKILIEKGISFFIVILFLALSVIIWDKKLSNYEFDTNENAEGLITSRLIGSINNSYRRLKIECGNISFDIIDSINTDKYLSDEDKSKLLTDIYDENKCSGIYVFKVFNSKNKQIDTILKYYENSMSMMDAVKFYMSNTIKRPFLTLDAYAKSYFSTLDLLERDINEYVVYPGLYFMKDKSWIYQNEIRDYGLYVFENERSNMWYVPSEVDDFYHDAFKERFHYFDEIPKYEEKSKLSDGISNLLKKISVPYILLFIIIYLLLPFVLIYSFIKYKKTNYNKKYYFICMLLAIPYLNLICHVLMGTILDRYIYIGIPLIMIGYIMLLFDNKDYNIK